MAKLGLEKHVVDKKVYESSVKRFRDARIVLPTFSQLADPAGIPESVTSRLASVGRDEPHPLNLFRVHWYNHPGRQDFGTVPEHLVLPESLTGVKAKIVALLGDQFPMIHAHKVLAAYGCLAPRIITGQFDPAEHKAVWPSTGNYCRGGVAISRIMESRGVAVLPEGMSRERFEWLERWVTEPSDIIRTPGSESNVKEIYDACRELDRDPHNIIFNQFSEFGNHLAHYFCTGQAAERVFDRVRTNSPRARLRAFVAASGSAGTLGAGDYLKEKLGSMIVVAEALECPTILYNGFGEHNIQGIGDKHIPLIHNVMNTDLAAAISDVSTDHLDILFNSTTGREYLASRRNVPKEVVEQLGRLGFSSICNILGAIKTAKHFDMNENDVIIAVATDGAELYETEHAKTLARDFPEGFDAVSAGEVYGRHVLGVATDHFAELSHVDRNRIFNLGYYTWVEQQGVSIEEFEARRQSGFWGELHHLFDAWDSMITEFNERTEVFKNL